ncbi:LarC family nickel insertion protein [bacterium]|nr:LarC family nickel insertion protein [bacterium]
MRIAFIDCTSGISGDMLLGALLDAGLSLTVLKNELAKLPIREPFELSMRQIRRGGIYGIRVDVVCHEKLTHRHLHDIETIIGQSSLDATCKDQAMKVFTCIGEAEAVVHKTSIEKVHLHEVGAIDSILDVVGCAVAIQKLGIEKMYTTPIALGGGTVTCSHGVMPVPVPATVELLGNYPVIHNENISGELCTPTGAALVKALSSGVKEDIPMLIRAVGYGAGSKQFDGILDLLSVTVGDV